MTDQDRSGLHTPQHRPSQDPRPDPEPAQDEGESNEFLDQLSGRNVAQTAYFDVSDVDPLEGVTMTDVYEGVTDVTQDHAEEGGERLDMLVERELRAGETDDPMEAVQEGLTYIPPIDPPVTTDPDSYESVQIASGFSVSADDVDPDEGGAERDFMAGDDMTAMVRHALRADAATTHLADRLTIATINGRVIIRGIVDDLDDTDNVIAVISDLPGVISVRDETTIRGI